MYKTLYVFALTGGFGSDEKWQRVGLAFPTTTGDGFDVLLDLLPLTTNATLVCRAYDFADPSEVAAAYSKAIRSDKSR